MLRFKASSFTTRTFISAVAAASFMMPAAAGAVSLAHQHIKLVADQNEVYVNGQQSLLEEPATLIQDQFYVPARWLADTLKLKLAWDQDTQSVRLVAPKAFLEFHASSNTIKVNGAAIPFDSVATLRNDRLLVKLSWLAQYTDLKVDYFPQSKSIEIRYVGTPGATYKESLLVKDDAQPNSRPVALFAFGKNAYRIGEKIEIVDLSYDPDAEGLPVYEWEGKEDAFYKPGVYPVTLKVKDGNGNVSEPFTKSITVLDEPYLTREQYPYHYKPAGSVFRADTEWLKRTFGEELKVPVVVKQPEDRRLIVGRSVEPVKSNGFLYREAFKGNARLFPQYINGSDRTAQFAIALQNSGDHEVTVTTTRKSEQAPSIYNNVRADKLAEDFLGSDPAADVLTIAPGQTVFYKVSPDVAPGQSFQGMYDIVTDGELHVSYSMIAPRELTYNLGSYRNVEQKMTGSGTYPVSNIEWSIIAKSLKEPMKAGFGDPAVEPAVKGLDTVEKQEAAPSGNAGIHYTVRLTAARHMAVALHPRDGFYQGAVRVNGRFIDLPKGGITSQDAVLLHRTTTKEEALVIELLPAGNTQLPVDLLLYPLTDK